MPKMNLERESNAEEGFRQKVYDIKLRKSTKKFLPNCYPGISILTQPLFMNLESFPHGARELVIEIGTSSIVYLPLPRYLILAPTDTLGL